MENRRKLLKLLNPQNGVDRSNILVSSRAFNRSRLAIYIGKLVITKAFSLNIKKISEDNKSAAGLDSFRYIFL